LPDERAISRQAEHTQENKEDVLAVMAVPVLVIRAIA
jgi:hypothetical protein